VLVRRALRGPLLPAWSLRTEIAAGAIQATVLRSKHRGIVWLRAVQSAFVLPSPVLSQVKPTPIETSGVRCRWIAPLEAPNAKRTIVYFHGGGYVIGSLDTHRDVMARLAVGACARVLGVDYRLSPEHPFPAAQEDCLAATRFAIAQAGSASRVVLAGDSAGGALCIATLCALRDAGEPLPAAAVLLCPWTDPLAEGGSMEANAPYDFGDREVLVDWIGKHMAGGDPRDPRVAPLHARLEGLPPLLVQAGGAEILRDQIEAFVDRARAARVAVRLDVYPDMVHVFQTEAALLTDAERALDEIARFVIEHVPG
jgi:monoterpene epsilon-lactone hydrolase